MTIEKNVTTPSQVALLESYIEENNQSIINQQNSIVSYQNNKTSMDQQIANAEIQITKLGAENQELDDIISQIS